jgi:hypothetical protein
VKKNGPANQEGVPWDVRVSVPMRTAQPLAVYDGQKLVGEIEDRGRRNVIAFRIEGARRRIKVGVFPTRILAMRALSGAGERGQQDA